MTPCMCFRKVREQEVMRLEDLQICWKNICLCFVEESHFQDELGRLELISRSDKED